MMKWISIAFFLGGLLLYISYEQQLFKNSTPDRSYSLKTVLRQDISQMVTISGKVSPRRSLQLKAPYSGYIQKLHVVIGDRVKEGQPLITINENLSNTTEVFPIRAPFAGLITNINVSKGVRVDAGDQAPMLQMLDDSQMYVTAEVSEIDYPKIRIGQKGLIRATALQDRSFTGKITSLGLESKNSSESYADAQVTFPVKIVIADYHFELKAGMSILVDIITEEKLNALSLPHEYVEETDGQYFVTSKNGEKINVLLGIQDEMSVEILEGLEEGDQVRQAGYLASGQVTNETY